jgi:DNA-binding CsgD family transcriptional regulator
MGGDAWPPGQPPPATGRPPPALARRASGAQQPRMGGLLQPLGPALLGQYLAQPRMLVVHGSFPFLHLCLLPATWPERRWSLASSGWRCGGPPESGMCLTPALGVFPIFGRRPRTAAVSLRPVARDNPGEMGGRVASPTFVGRVEELQTLEAARVRAANGDPAVVLVGGEAGVGKTRLIAELTSRCANDGMRVLAGGCVPVGDGALPYAPIVEALRVLLGDVGVGAVRELVGPSWPELARLLPALGAPDRTGQPDQAAQSRLFELLLGLLGRLAEQAPLVLVVEDLHWADRSTLDLLAFLVRNLRRERVLLVVSYRNDEPGQQRLGPYLAELDRGGPVQRLELARLDPAQTTAQLLGILGTAPAAELAAAVFARSEGNPFFTEELLAAVRAGSVQLPATLGDLLRGRVQPLPDPARHVLRVVAVAGRRVPHQLLAAVARLSEPQLDQALQVAVTNQLLVTTPGQDGYDVRHALLREVIDADLLPGERGRLHAGLAQTLTERPELADGPPAVAAAELAAHWDAAGDLERALPAAVKAGLAAERAHAFPEAQRHYERALQLWEQVTDPGRAAGLDRVELLTRAADAAVFAGQTQRALVLLTEALDQLDPASDPVRAALLHMRLGGARWTAGDEPGCLAAFEEAVRILPGEPSAERARVLGYYAQWLMMAGRDRDAVGRAKQALEVARTVGARAEEGHALDILGSCTGDIQHLEGALRIAEEVGNVGGIVRAYLNLGSTLSQAGRVREGLDVTRRGLAVAHELGLEQAWGIGLAANLAVTFFDLGDWQESDRVLAEALERETMSASRLHVVKGFLELGRGDFPTARHHLELARRLNPSPFEATWTVTSLAELAIWEGRYDDARAAVDQAVGVLERLDPEQELPLTVAAGTYALGLRVEADCAELARAARSPAGVQEARRRAEPLIATLRAMTGPAADPWDAWLPCSAALGEAEWSRLEERPDPQLWQRAAEHWERLELPYPAAYAHFRQAEALLAARAPRARIEPVLRAAHRTAVALGAAPLRREIEGLAGRGRLRLEEPAAAAAAPQASPSPAASFGLTRREAEVLVLVAAGRTNRQIGQQLFITEKTASVHVSRILAKLGVAGRGEAAAAAHRLGLDR